jgi:hypothetical protein
MLAQVMPHMHVVATIDLTGPPDPEQHKQPPRPVGGRFVIRRTDLPSVILFCSFFRNGPLLAGTFGFGVP